LPLGPPPLPPKHQRAETPDSHYNSCDTLEARGEPRGDSDMDTDESGVNVDGLVDYMATLVPGSEPPTEDSFPSNVEEQELETPPDTPPALPPKQRHRPSTTPNGDVSSPLNGRVPSEPELGLPLSVAPQVPPRRRENKKSPVRPVSNGLPPTPKVHMGACFSKVFNGCPLHINFTASWVHPETKNQHILIGANEGIYTLNLTEIHEGSMDLLHARRCVWIYVIKDVMMSLSGKTPQLYRHDLLALHSKQSHRFSLPVNKIPEKLVPRKFVMTTKVPDTKGCIKCCVGRNPYNGYKYLCGAMSSQVFLMQWYEPLNKFMLLKQFDCAVQQPLNMFEMLITPELEYPLVCVGVSKGLEKSHLTFNIINLNSTTNWFIEGDPDEHSLEVVNVTQLEKDTILVCYNNRIKVVNMNGKLKSSRRQAADLHFDFPVESLVCLKDSVLAFHQHGMQGRSFKTNEVTQEICDRTRIFRLLGSDRVIVLESRPTEDNSSPSNLYVLAGHENSY